MHLNFSSIKRFKDTLFIALLLLGGVLLIFFVGYPSYKQIGKLKADGSVNQEKLRTLVSKRKTLENLSEISGTLDENLNIVKKAVPDDTNVPQLLSQVQQIASEVGMGLSSLQFTALSPSSSAKKSNSKEKGSYNIDIGANVVGSYSQLVKFLQSLERALRVMSVESMQVNSASKEDLTLLKANLSLVGFYQEPKGAGSKLSLEDSSLDTSVYKSTLELLRTFREYETVETVVEVSTKEENE